MYNAKLGRIGFVYTAAKVCILKVWKIGFVDNHYQSINTKGTEAKVKKIIKTVLLSYLSKFSACS